jgi:glutathione transport system ATP-binding protein
MAIVERNASRVAVMYLGQIVELGPRQSVFNQPQHPYTQRLLASVPVADPENRQPRRFDDSEIPSPLRKVGETVTKPVIGRLHRNTGSLTALHCDNP